MNRHISRLQKLRASFQPHLPKILQGIHSITFEKGKRTESIADQDEIRALFPKTYGHPLAEGKAGTPKECKPLKVGVVFSGGQAPGGHNVITGLFDALQTLNPSSRLIGFLGGPAGIIKNQILRLDHEQLALYRNQGGFDLIGSGRTKIESEEDLAASRKTVTDHDLDGLVIIGGDDSNTNAALLAEYFQKTDCKTSVIGVPKTIDGDLKNAYVATSFGFDTAAKTYCEMIGNIGRDALSAKKYWHFIRLMGRSASHITLECALATHPNITLIGEEIAQKKQTLQEVVSSITDIVQKRSSEGKNYGIALIPEGIIEFIPEFVGLISELNQVCVEHKDVDLSKVPELLSQESKQAFASLPQEIQKQLLLDRDPHGNVQVSMIETEKLLISAVKTELEKQGFKGKFTPQGHFFGYEGRAGFPSNFDTHYCYALGYTAAALVDRGYTGYMACVGHLHRLLADWTIMGIPITMLMNMETRKGKRKPVIQKTLVDLTGKPFLFFSENRQEWAEQDNYRFPGPIQFFGEAEMVDGIPLTMQIESRTI